MARPGPALSCPGPAPPPAPAAPAHSRRGGSAALRRGRPAVSESFGPSRGTGGRLRAGGAWGQWGRGGGGDRAARGDPGSAAARSGGAGGAGISDSGGGVGSAAWGCGRNVDVCAAAGARLGNVRSEPGTGSGSGANDKRGDGIGDRTGADLISIPHLRTDVGDGIGDVGISGAGRDGEKVPPRGAPGALVLPARGVSRDKL